MNKDFKYWKAKALAARNLPPDTYCYPNWIFEEQQKEAAEEAAKEKMMISSRPILFSPPMVKVLRKGIKSQTRRLVQPQHEQADLSACPYGKPGDTLYVREAWRTLASLDKLSPSQIQASYAGKTIPLQYSDDQHLNWPQDATAGRWRIAMHMPKEFSRVSLIITKIEKAPLQSISRTDAIREGIPWSPGQRSEPLIDFALLWDSLHPLFGGWASNPLVWVVTFDLLAMELMDGEVEEAMRRKKAFDDRYPVLVQKTL